MRFRRGDTRFDAQPNVKANEWHVLSPPEIGNGSPTKTVSVVIPAHNPARLPLVLAALAAQGYPAQLLEVVVVDDGSAPPVQLPELRPEHTRLVSVHEGWGRANACHYGALVSEGEILHWLDADMVAHRDEVEAQARWHHLIDYAVVLGHKQFVDLHALDHLAPGALCELIVRGALEELSDQPGEPHAWLEEILGLTADLSAAGPRAMRVHVGSTATVSRSLYFASGGMDTDLVLGEDIVLGYRLREAGAVFVPDREARCLHLGKSTVMGRGVEVNRYNRAYLMDRVPEFRGHRVATPRTYAVPYVEVVLDVTDSDAETVSTSVDHLLGGTVPDVVVRLVGPWSNLEGGRRDVFLDDWIDLRQVRTAYQSDSRVRWAEAASTADPTDAPFRLRLASPGWIPVADSLERLLRRMEEDPLGLVVIKTPDGQRLSLERTAAVNRARRIAGPNTVVDAKLLSRVYEVLHADAADVGFVAVASAPSVRRVRGLVPWGMRPAKPK